MYFIVITVNWFLYKIHTLQFSSTFFFWIESDNIHTENYDRDLSTDDFTDNIDRYNFVCITIALSVRIIFYDYFFLKQ